MFLVGVSGAWVRYLLFSLYKCCVRAGIRLLQGSAHYVDETLVADSARDGDVVGGASRTGWVAWREMWWDE